MNDMYKKLIKHIKQYINDPNIIHIEKSHYPNWTFLLFYKNFEVKCVYLDIPPYTLSNLDNEYLYNSIRGILDIRNISFMSEFEQKELKVKCILLNSKLYQTYEYNNYSCKKYYLYHYRYNSISELRMDDINVYITLYNNKVIDVPIIEFDENTLIIYEKEDVSLPLSPTEEEYNKYRDKYELQNVYEMLYKKVNNDNYILKYEDKIIIDIELHILYNIIEVTYIDYDIVCFDNIKEIYEFSDKIKIFKLLNI